MLARLFTLRGLFITVSKVLDPKAVTDDITDKHIFMNNGLSHAIL